MTDQITTEQKGDRYVLNWHLGSKSATFREELDETRTLTVDLIELWTEVPEPETEPVLIRLTFAVDHETYHQLENNSWFGLKPGLAQGLGLAFDAARPIHIHARVDDDTMEAGLFPDLDPADPRDGLEELLEPLFDEDEYGIESPLGYEYEHVGQLDGDGFSPQTVAEHERKLGLITPPPEYFE